MPLPTMRRLSIHDAAPPRAEAAHGDEAAPVLAHRPAEAPTPEDFYADLITRQPSVEIDESNAIGMSLDEFMQEPAWQAALQALVKKEGASRDATHGSHPATPFNPAASFSFDHVTAPAPAPAQSTSTRVQPARTTRARRGKPSDSDEEFVAYSDAESVSDAGSDADGDAFDEDGSEFGRAPRAGAFIEQADLNVPLTTIVDDKEEHKLAQKLVVLQQKLVAEGKRLKALGSLDRKRKRNQLASQISRLRKKLLVFELQRRYIATCAENAALKARVKELESKVRACLCADCR